MNKSCNIACGMDSWQTRQSHFDKQTVTAKQEIYHDFLEPVLPSNSQSRSYNPYAYHLEKIEWSIFGTITFRDDAFIYDSNLSEELRKNECRKLIGKAATKLRLRQRRLLYYGKSEFGAGNRGHYNFLIGKDGTESVTPSGLAGTLQDLWTGGLHPQGTAVIEPFMAELHKQGIAYQTKHEFDEFGNRLNNPEMFSYILEKRIKENAQRN